MERKGLIKILCLMFLVSVLASGSVYAGGIALYEFGSPDVGLAAAGYAARAQDASTVFTNPAGMSRLDKSQALVSAQALYGNVKFSPNSSTNVTGDDGGNSVGWLPGGSLFVVQKINQDWSIGFGAFSYFGLSENYGESWVGRYYVQKATLVGMTLMPAISYRVNDWLYLGVGLNAMRGNLDAEIAINGVLDARPDGRLKYSDREWGYGANVGILVEPQKGTRFGFTWLSEVKLDFSAAPTFEGLGPLLGAALAGRGLTTNPLDTTITVPQMVMFSVYHELNPQWAIMGNIGWQQWSHFGFVDVQITSNDPKSLTTNLEYNDTWHVALGAQYRPTQVWTFSGGVAYDSSAVDDNKRTVVLAMGETWRFGLGAQYAFTPNLTLGVAYDLIWMVNKTTDQNRGIAGHVAGDYDNGSISVFALNLSWKY